MTRRTVLVVAVLAPAVLVAACSDKTETTDKGAMPARTINAGAVEVTITPTRLDDEGATFDIDMNTHADDLSEDLAASAKLVVDGAIWPVDRWTGDGPSGHHRSGQLRFKPNGAARGAATLTLKGFPGPVEASWKLPGG